MKALLVTPEVSNIYFKQLGLRVSDSEQIGFCCDGRMLEIQRDKKGNIIGFELI